MNRLWLCGLGCLLLATGLVVGCAGRSGRCGSGSSVAPHPGSTWTAPAPVYDGSGGTHGGSAPVYQPASPSGAPSQPAPGSGFGGSGSR